jgi:Sulfotransferase family
MITRALHDSGLHLVGTGADELIEAADDNPEGFWENKAIRDCNDDLLEATGGAWDNPPVLPPVAADDPRVAHLADASATALAALREHESWGFKDPRVCLTAAYWLDLEPELRFVVCVRHPLEVALSLKRRNQNSYSLGLALWERYYATVLDQVPVERRIVSHYDTFFVDPEGEMARLCAFAGLDPAPPRVRRDLRHHTMGADLGDAGVSAGVRSLYATLCKEAGAPQPRDLPPDEGRVRRLILDGAVAQRHAEQRQEAIERLEEREREFRAAHAKAEQGYRDKVRDLEAQLAAAHRDGETAAALEALRESVDRRSSRFLRGTIARAARAARAARTATRRLPPSAQQTLRRGRSLARRAATEPGPTARIVQDRALWAAHARAARLPPPARRAALRGRDAYQRAAAQPEAAARAVVQRLPDPARRVARRAWVATARAQRKVGQRISNPALRPAPVPKGPPARLWKGAFRVMVDAAWTGDDPWLVVTPGSPGSVSRARFPRATPFPGSRGGRPLADDLSHIAHLEAQRFAGHPHLVVPEGSRPWFRQRVELRDHLVRSYRTAVDEAGAGLVFDLGQAPEPGRRSLRAAIEELAAGRDPAPAVLDCTRHALEAELPDLAVFSPAHRQGRLPYLDRSVDVVVAEPDHDLGDARRVAALGVITVAPGDSGPVVRSLEAVAPAAGPAAAGVLVWSGPATDPRWEPALAERAEQAGASLLVGRIGADGLDAVADHDVVVALEPHVLPLPGSIRAAAAAAAADPAAAVAGKILRADGSLEAAGGTVFFDRSVALIAGSSADVRAPWHEYVRPVCWAPGLVAAASPLWTGVHGPVALEGRAYLREWCAALWSDGSTVVYHPDVVAVRVAGDGGEPSIPLEESAWQRVLDLRPPRPPELSDGAWRYQLDHDDVEACRA